MFSTNFTLYLALFAVFISKTLHTDSIPPNHKPLNNVLFDGFKDKQLFRTLGVGTCLFADAIARRKYPCYPVHRQKSTLIYLIFILLSNSYSPEPNPGPTPTQTTLVSPVTTDCSSSSEQITQSSWVCGTCDLAVTWNDRGVVCDQCGQWFHGHCQSIDSAHYDLLNDSNESWYCAICGHPNQALDTMVSWCVVWCRGTPEFIFRCMVREIIKNAISLAMFKIL